MEQLLIWSDALFVALAIAFATAASTLFMRFLRIKRIKHQARAERAEELAYAISQSTYILISKIADKRSLHLHLRAPSGIAYVLEFTKNHPDFAKLSLLTMPAKLSFRFLPSPIETVGAGEITAHLIIRLVQSD